MSWRPLRCMPPPRAWDSGQSVAGREQGAGSRDRGEPGRQEQEQGRAWQAGSREEQGQGNAEQSRSREQGSAGEYRGGACALNYQTKCPRKGFIQPESRVVLLIGFPLVIMY